MSDKIEKILNMARTKLAEELELIDEDCFSFCWIVDYPLYEWNESDKKLDFFHNPFSMPQGALEELNKSKNETKEKNYPKTF